MIFIFDLLEFNIAFKISNFKGIFCNAFNAIGLYNKSINTEAVTQRCSVKKVFQETSQNSQENTYARASF